MQLLWFWSKFCDFGENSVILIQVFNSNKSFVIFGAIWYNFYGAKTAFFCWKKCQFKIWLIISKNERGYFCLPCSLVFNDSSIKYNTVQFHSQALENLVTTPLTAFNDLVGVVRKNNKPRGETKPAWGTSCSQIYCHNL